MPPAAVGPSRAPSAVELLERAVAYTRGSLLLVRPEDLTRATPCSQWDLCDLLRHLDDSLEAMGVAAQATSLTLVPAPTPAGGLDLLDSICARARALLGHWHPSLAGEVELGDVSLSREVLGAVGALEITLHGWDVARSLGRHRPIPPLLALDLWPIARDHITEADRPAPFGLALEVGDWASAQEHLLAHAGRSAAAR